MSIILIQPNQWYPQHNVELEKYYEIRSLQRKKWYSFSTVLIRQSSFSLAEKIFREIKYLSKLATSIVNFCQKSVRLNFHNFHITAMHSCIFSLFQRLWDNMYNFILFVIADVVDYASRLLGQHNAKTFFWHENAFGVILITFGILLLQHGNWNSGHTPSV